MKNITQEELVPLAITAAILLAFGVLGGIFSATSFTGMLSLSFATFFYFVLPGYMILLHFDLSSLQRIVLGTAVSAAVIPVTLYALDIVNIPLSRLTITVVIGVICAVSVMIKKS